MLKVNPFPLGLRQILEDISVIKVFHDFCEDTAALVQQNKVHCSGVFDTQIAHCILSEEISKQTKTPLDPRDQNISLNALLQRYVGAENTRKEAIGLRMKTDPDFWWNVSPSSR